MRWFGSWFDSWFGPWFGDGAPAIIALPKTVRVIADDQGVGVIDEPVVIVVNNACNVIVEDANG